MLKGRLNPSFAFAAVTELLMAVAGTKCVHGEELESGFPQASVDYFHDMDDSIALTPDQVRGRNTWMIWTGGDQAFWNYLARRSFGTFDLLKVLDSRGRSTRFADYGLMNEPGFAQATKPDEFGLWLDVRDGTSDPVSFPKIPSGLDWRDGENHRITLGDVCGLARARNVRRRSIQVAEPA